MTRLGALVLQTRHGPGAVEVWREVEDAGFDVGYVADHLSHHAIAGRWWADGWTTLAAASQVTRRLELGPLVASALIRNPAWLARASATLQDLSGGRFVLGLGAGVAGDALVDRGSSVPPREMTARYAEVVAALRELWSGAQEWRGEHVAIDGVVVAPFPPGLSVPHLMLAAHGPRGFELVARHGDGWSTYGGPAAGQLGGDALWAALEEQAAGVTAACDRLGRDPAGLRRSVLLGFGPDRPLASVEAFTRSVARAEQAGFDEVVVYWPDGDPGSRFWADPEVVLEAVRTVRAG